MKRFTCWIVTVCCCIFLFACASKRDRAEKLYDEIAEAWEKSNYSLCLEKTNKAIEIDDSYAVLYYVRGNIYAIGNTDYAAAIPEYTKSIELGYTDKLAYHGRGISYMMLEDFNNAITDFTTVIEIDPEYAAAYYTLAKSYAGLSDENNMLINLQKAAQLGHNKSQELLKKEGYSW